MAVQVPPISLLLFLSVLVTSLAAVSGWRHREVAGSRPFVVLMILVSYWALTYGIQLLRPSLGYQLFWDGMQYAGGFFAAVAFLSFTLHYTGHEHLLTRRRLAGLLLVPLVTSVAVWIPGLQELVRADATLVEVGASQIAHISYGPLFPLAVGYSYVLIAVGLGLLVSTAVRAPGLYRKQATLITLGALVPIVGSVVTYALDVTVIDLTPVALSAFGATFALALSRYRLLDVVPLARNEVIRQIDDGMVVTDERGQLVDINAAARDILGVSDVIGTQLSELSADPATALRETPVGETAEFSVGDDTPRYFECRTERLAAAERGGRGRLYILRDITEQRTRERWFRSLTEYSSDIICVLDEDLRVSYVSPSISTVLGYDPAAVDGRDFLEFVDGDDRDRVEGRLREAAADPTQVTFRARTADGAWRTLQSKNRDRLSDPVVGGIVLNVRDVTESRARQRELEAKNERLDTFAGIVSHDLRNPLSVAKGRTELLYETLSDGSAGTKHVESLDDALDRMETIIEETLVLARQGETITGTERLAIGPFVRECWGMVETADSSVEVLDEFTLQGDPERLEHVFENLFANAVEHGGPGVTVRVGRLDGSGFYVEDDGPGIPDGEREAVFEFGETSSSDGTGFGLAIVRRIAEAHGWHVQVTGGREGGARFEFTAVESLSRLDPPADPPTD